VSIGLLPIGSQCFDASGIGKSFGFAVARRAPRPGA